VARKKQGNTPGGSGGGAATGKLPPDKVVKNGSTSESTVQIAPSMSQQQASTQKVDISELLADSDANLQKSANRQLTLDQQAMASQIRNYMDQAKTAEKAGDLARARNLAFKAHLLSQELVKP
jgi:hypothetical protein